MRYLKILLIPFFLSSAWAADKVNKDDRFKICSITINSDEEIQSFKKNVQKSKDKFEFFELAPPKSREKPASAT